MMKQITGATTKIQKKEIGAVFHTTPPLGLYQHLLKMESPLHHDDIFVHVSFSVVHISTRDPCICLYLLLLRYDNAIF